MYSFSQSPRYRIASRLLCNDRARFTIPEVLQATLTTGPMEPTWIR